MSETTCVIDGCCQKAVARNWCRMHYARWRKHGDPGTADRQRLPGTVCHVLPKAVPGRPAGTGCASLAQRKPGVLPCPGALLMGAMRWLMCATCAGSITSGSGAGSSTTPQRPRSSVWSPARSLTARGLPTHRAGALCTTPGLPGRGRRAAVSQGTSRTLRARHALIRPASGNREREVTVRATGAVSCLMALRQSSSRRSWLSKTVTARSAP